MSLILQKNSNSKFVTDVDGVLLCWFSGLKNYLENKGASKEVIQMVTENMLTSNFLDANKIFKDVEIGINDFNRSDFIQMLPILQKKSLDVLRKLHAKHDIIALTCLGTEEEQKLKRIRNLESVYGNIFKDVICIGISESKEDYLRDLNKDKSVIAYVDDRMKHIYDGINAGVEKNILFTKGRTQLSDIENSHTYKASCWSDIEKLLVNKRKIKLRK